MLDRELGEKKKEEKLCWRKQGAIVGECCKGWLSFIGLSTFRVLCPFAVVLVDPSRYGVDLCGNEGRSTHFAVGSEGKIDNEKYFRWFNAQKGRNIQIVKLSRLIDNSDSLEAQNKHAAHDVFGHVSVISGDRSSCGVM